MENLEKIKENFVNQLDNEISSIYTKENVKCILNIFVQTIQKDINENLVPANNEKFSLDKIKEAINYLYENNSSSDFIEVDYDTAELSMDYNNVVKLDAVITEFQPKQFYNLLTEILLEN